MTTFDPATKPPLAVLLNGNLTMKPSGASGESGIVVRSTTGKSGSERGYAEFKLDSTDAGSFGPVVGLINSSFVIGTDDVGLNTNSFGYFSTLAGGDVYYDSSPVAGVGGYVAGDTVFVQLDRGAGTATFGIAGGGSGSVNVSPLGAGAWYIAVQGWFDGDQWTGNFRDPFVRTPAWDPPRGGGGVAIRRFYRRST